MKIFVSEYLSTLDLYLFGYSAEQLSWSFTFVLEPSKLSPWEANDACISAWYEDHLSNNSSARFALILVFYDIIYLFIFKIKKIKCGLKKKNVSA